MFVLYCTTCVCVHEVIVLQKNEVSSNYLEMKYQNQDNNTMLLFQEI